MKPVTLAATENMQSAEYQYNAGRAFVIRPFGIKATASNDTIDFDRVHEKLIAVALQEAGFTGGTTEKFIAQGSIHEDMFREIVIADLVIADVSIHNANAFYELGIRHALRKGHTILIRADKYNDKRVFDLNSEKNMSYNLDDPGASVDTLLAIIRSTVDRDADDSPVFRLLPRLKPVNPSDAQVVPRTFSETLSEIVSGNTDDKASKLLALKHEAVGQFWEREGFLNIARAQSELPDHQGAIETWEYLRQNTANEAEASHHLATSYQKTGELAKSETAANRSLHNDSLSDWEKAQTHSLIGSNIKRRWFGQFCNVDDLAKRQCIALSSDLLRQAYLAYAKGFQSHQSHFYSGLNAIAMRSIQLELASMHPQEWEYLCEIDEREPQYTLTIQRKHLVKLVAATDLAIGTSLRQNSAGASPWNMISAADLLMITCEDPARVVAAYRRIAHLLDGKALAVIQEQLSLFRTLAVLKDNVDAVVESLSINCR